MLFKFFEKSVPCYPSNEPALPPRGFLAFVWACAPECVVVHALLADEAYVELSGVFSRFTSTDAVPHPSNRIALASLLADALRRNLHD